MPGAAACCASSIQRPAAPCSAALDNPVDKQAWIERCRRAASEILEDRGFTVGELEGLWRQRGEDYFLRERAEDIAWHTESIASHHERDKPLVLIRNNIESTVANTTQIFIYARTNVQLFSTICAELEQLDLSVHDAPHLQCKQWHEP